MRCLVVSRRSLPALALAAVLAVGGCSRSDSLGAEAKAGDEKDYVAGDGSVTELAASDRGAPVTAKGSTAEGKPLDVSTLRGGVVVVNVWYAACAPCRKEAPDLERLHTSLAASKVSFVGINTRDDPATARAFQSSFRITYPSIMDPSGAVIVGLRGKVSPNAVPTTLVLDKKGRVAGRVLGLAEASTLKAMITKVQAETG